MIPRAFISSTVTDFRDLRAALKYWIEELGFHVDASEFADFTRWPDAEAVEECLNSVKACDIYILLIGDERGSVREMNGEIVSITQQEYRTAYSSYLETGKPAIVTFLRRERSPRDLDFTTRFISEVRRAGEQDQRANWTTPFSGFRDIVDGLRAAVPALRDSLPDQAMLIGVRDECLANLRSFTVRLYGHPQFIDAEMRNVRAQIRMTKQDVKESYHLTHEQLKWGSLFAGVGTPPLDSLSTLALDAAIASGRLLKFEPAAGELLPSELSTALSNLRGELRLLIRRREFVDSEVREAWNRAWSEFRQHDQGVDLPGFAVLDLLALYDTQRNVVAMMVALVRFLSGTRPTPSPDHIRDQTPVPELQAGIDAERISVDELDRAIANNDPWIASAAANLGPDDEARLSQIVDRLRSDVGDKILGRLAKGETIPEGEWPEGAAERLRRALELGDDPASQEPSEDS